MNTEEFVEAIRRHVRQGCIESVIAVLENVPGRRPPQNRQQRSTWFRSLDPEDRRHVEEVVAAAVDATIFHLFCVLDGVRAIEDGPDKGTFELRYHGKADETLSPSDGDFLHDLYRSDE